jgi:hypothetical protein
MIRDVSQAMMAKLTLIQTETQRIGSQLAQKQRTEEMLTRNNLHASLAEQTVPRIAMSLCRHRCVLTFIPGYSCSTHPRRRPSAPSYFNFPPCSGRFQGHLVSL